MSKVLFLLKKNGEYNFTPFHEATSKSGLLNSVKYLAEALHRHLGIEVAIETCIDGNEIDKFVHKHRPNYCIIDALWATPKKMNELCDIWKNVDFIVRIHSKIPFLANEGIAVEWIKEYVAINKNLFVALNNRETYEDFMSIGIPCYYMPNIYDINVPKERFLDKILKIFPYKHCNYELKVGCYGAIRPLKNQLIQSIAAIKYCERNNLKLKFYVNATRMEQGGENVFKNIKALFKGTPHELVEVGWLPHHEFKKLIAQMDLGMQVSFSESFNIVTADFVDVGVPIVVSRDIHWVSKKCVAEADNVESIYDRIHYVLENKHRIVQENREELDHHNKLALINYYMLMK